MRVTLNVWYSSLYLLSLWDYRRAPTNLVRVVLGMEPMALGMFSKLPASWAPALAWECYFSSWICWRKNFVSKVTGPKGSDLMGLGGAGGPGQNVCSVSPWSFTVAILPVRCETRLLLKSCDLSPNKIPLKNMLSLFKKRCIYLFFCV